MKKSIKERISEALAGKPLVEYTISILARVPNTVAKVLGLTKGRPRLKGPHPSDLVYTGNIEGTYAELHVDRVADGLECYVKFDSKRTPAEGYQKVMDALDVAAERSGIRFVSHPFPRIAHLTEPVIIPGPFYNPRVPPSFQVIYPPHFQS